jgi:hypothetical protein
VLSGVDPSDDLEPAASFNKPVSFPALIKVVRKLCQES